MTKEEEEYKAWLINRIEYHKRLLNDLSKFNLHCDNMLIVEYQQHLKNYFNLTGTKYKS